MSAQNLVLIGVAVAAIIGAIGAFTIAFKRSQPELDPLAGLSKETRKADRSMEGVRIEPIATAAGEVVDEVDEEVNVVDEPEPDFAEEAEGFAVVRESRVVEVTTEEAGVTRRQFFNRAILATFGSFLAFMGIDSLAFFWPRLSGGFGADIDAGPVADLQSQVFTSDGAILPVFVPEARAYIVPAPPELSTQFAEKSVEANGLMALFQRCVHLGCRVPWCGPSQGFECPCHGSKYNSVGEYFAGPAPRNLDRFVVELNGDRFIIKTGTVIETPRAPTRSVPYPQGPSCIGAA
ncbi:MAG: ubiquinol-cytochrome c reductase iron-sulfur subunit [Acidimicrobiia bacterium]|nr:ubiquinol-cytochrome c reductase iron-sulfur subunit [Acidimicrobiia bacterium]MDH3462243.1 ubiquinol-cytochrome c reductase iron-sulfur subunit [Acidimicrobiia bacterium]